MQKIKILFIELSYLTHNYGAQGIAFPLMEKLNEHFDAEYTFALSSKKYFRQDLIFSENLNFKIIEKPRLKLSSILKINDLKKLLIFQKRLKEYDVVIDSSGIEFIGNQSFKKRWNDFITVVYPKILAKKCNKLYLKYTKSYGPFPHAIYRMMVKLYLNKLPFIFVRGNKNLSEMKKLNLKPPLYSFPDISIALESEGEEWAKIYLKKTNFNFSKSIVGISPSVVINKIKTRNSTCGENHIKLCKKIIHYFQAKDCQILLLPHSIGDGKNLNSCDLALCKKIYSQLENTDKIFLLNDMELTYKQVRGIISLLDFYVTGRYHSLSSALSVGIPVVSIAWHIKYNDIMSLFLDDYLAIDCRTTSIQKAMSQIIKYYEQIDWFDKKRVDDKKNGLINKIDMSINIVTEEINKFIAKN